MPVRPLGQLQAGVVQRLQDRRGKRVVFLSHCILNENTRYLGGACRAGCVREIVEQCLDLDLGIVQMPCPEQRAWGGVLKRFLLLAYGLKERHPLAYHVRRPLIHAGLWYTRRVYRGLAKSIAAQIEDYQTSGFSVVAVIGIDGSPSCGVATTIDRAAFAALASVRLAAITVEHQNGLLRRFLRRGRGIFIEELQNELKRRQIDLPFLAHDLFAELSGRRSTVRLERVMARTVTHQQSR